jgi:hypothetical protein
MMAHFIPLIKTKKYCKALAILFMREIRRLQGILCNIISDQDSRLRVKLEKILITTPSILLQISTAFHSESDSQSEDIN